MKINSNFVIRNIRNTVILFPVKKNPISDDPIYINNVVYQVLLCAPNSNNSRELCRTIVKLFSLSKDNDINQIKECVSQLLELGLIYEEDTVE